MQRETVTAQVGSLSLAFHIGGKWQAIKKGSGLAPLPFHFLELYIAGRLCGGANHGQFAGDRRFGKQLSNGNL